MKKTAKKITYKKAGVDISGAEELIKGISGLVDTTRIKGSMDSIGGFGGFFDTGLAGEKGSLLVASTDGVGTKLKIAFMTNKHDTVGMDLVAMCVNDILCCGARPLFFLDYFACGKLEKKVWKEVLSGIVDGCRQAGCALLGGETAEMPGMYAKGDYDLAGFSVGAVSRKNVIDGKKIRKGNVILGIASTGLHSNGFSLVRKVFSASEIKKRHKEFLEPTAIYVKPFLSLSKEIKILGASHITGGGVIENIPRMLGPGYKAVIDPDSWEIPPIFKELGERAGIGRKEMYRTFNMGIGMAIAVSRSEAAKAKEILRKKFGISGWVIGYIEERSGEKGPGVELRKGVKL